MLPAQEISKKPTEITVWLDENQDDEKYLKKFHCSICGKIVFEYYSKIRLITPGNHSEKNPKVIECGGNMTLCYDGINVSEPEYINGWDHQEAKKYPVCPVGKLKTFKCRTKYFIS